MQKKAIKIGNEKENKKIRKKKKEKINLEVKLNILRN